jgi:hypothetical protein
MFETYITVIVTVDDVISFHIYPVNMGNRE